MTRKFIGIQCEEKAPTRQHRPAIWENMLGTVMAMNDAGEAVYFDYDYEAAKAWAGINDESDCRLFRNKQHVSWVNKGDQIPMNQLVLWVRR